MKQQLSLVTLVVDDYDVAITFYRDTLGFELIEDTELPLEAKRWVIVKPQGSQCGFVLGRATHPSQEAAIGNQTGGRVGFFLRTDDFWRDYHDYQSRGVRFIRNPKQAEYGMVAVFQDLYGNLWDLLGD
ncbi:MAG: VOC family protein [Culicoidibacterales bacterium]